MCSVGNGALLRGSSCGGVVLQAKEVEDSRCSRISKD
jgi:hypothetical protein